MPERSPFTVATAGAPLTGVLGGAPLTAVPGRRSLGALVTTVPIRVGVVPDGGVGTIGVNGAQATATPTTIASPPIAQYAATALGRLDKWVEMAALTGLMTELFTFPWTTGVTPRSENVMVRRRS